jgi:hypothetical protein
MIPRLLRTQKKLEKYAIKLDSSPYYLAARILDPECRTSFLKKKNANQISQEGQQKIFLVRKLWEKFRDTTSSSVSYESTQESKSASEPTKVLSVFHQTRRRYIEEQTRPQSEDELDLYIQENAIPLDNHTTSLQWWNLPLQRTRFPRLSQLAIEVLSIPGMSDKPERVFSGARRRVPWDRTTTSSRTLEETECLKDWADHGILNILL